MSGKNQHVVPHNGQWGIRGEGNERLTRIYERQSDAINDARIISQNQGSEFIHSQPSGSDPRTR
jgi:hypothetical protein